MRVSAIIVKVSPLLKGVCNVSAGYVLQPRVDYTGGPAYMVSLGIVAVTQRAKWGADWGTMLYVQVGAHTRLG